jgi:hypothetical protein
MERPAFESFSQGLAATRTLGEEDPRDLRLCAAALARDDLNRASQFDLGAKLQALDRERLVLHSPEQQLPGLLGDRPHGLPNYRELWGRELSPLRLLERQQRNSTRIGVAHRL